MDHQGGANPSMGVGDSEAQLPYGFNPYEPSQISGASGSVVTSSGAIQTTSQLAGGNQQQLQQQLKTFGKNQYQEIDMVTDFKNLECGIRKLMTGDKDVKAISDEAPAILATACEMFISDLTLRSWNHTEKKERTTVQKDDIAAAITETDFDFLVGSEPQEDLKDELLASTRRGTMPVADPDDDLPFTYLSNSPQYAPQAGATGAIMAMDH
ncbi:hypothetical protein K1719_033216 [Acacia pycnantha]|nr:hypothetical protein K1719_033216 [Acacia pycnantha]